MISIDTWAEIRRLHHAERVPIKQIARDLGVGRNTVRRALAAEQPPARRAGAARDSKFDPYLPRVRALLREHPTMPATVIAQRVDWTGSASLFRAKVAELRAYYRAPDPADRLNFTPGEVIQCDLWFPTPRIPVGSAQTRVLPVLTMVSGYSRRIEGLMLPSRQGGDLTAGMWHLLQRFGGVPRNLLWDREAAIGSRGVPTIVAATFAGQIATRLKLAPARDPETKGIVERANRYLETSFLPGRFFHGPTDFNEQLHEWTTRHANLRLVRATGSTPADRHPTDLTGMHPLPKTPPVTGLFSRVRLGRDYYVRVDSNDYSVNPAYIGRFVTVTTTLTDVNVVCDGQLAALHTRSLQTHETFTDQNHVDAAARLRALRRAQDRPTNMRFHHDGHHVQLRALTDYDAMFGVTFDTPDHTIEREAQ